MTINKFNCNFKDIICECSVEFQLFETTLEGYFVGRAFKRAMK